MKKELNKGVFFAILAIVVVLLGWWGWWAMETPENRGLSEEKEFRAAEAKARANGIDLRRVPQWAGLYYKYHPEEKPPSPPQAAGR